MRQFWTLGRLHRALAMTGCLFFLITAHPAMAKSIDPPKLTGGIQVLEQALPVHVEILPIESETHIDLTPWNRILPSYRIRGVILIPSIPITPGGTPISRTIQVTWQPLILNSRDAQIPILLHGTIGGIAINDNPGMGSSSLILSSPGPTLSIDLMGIPDLPHALSRTGMPVHDLSALSAGYYSGTLTISAMARP